MEWRTSSWIATITVFFISCSNSIKPAHSILSSCQSRSVDSHSENKIRINKTKYQNNYFHKNISKKKIRRGSGFNKKSSFQKYVILGNNIASFTGKKNSFVANIESLNASVVMLQETKLYRKGQVRIENYDVYENVRNSGEGGGLLTLVHENLNSVQIPLSSNSKASENILVIEADLGKERVRFINAYGPQETASKEVKIDFFSLLDQEIHLAIDCGQLVCVELDGNGKFGGDIIRGDPHEMTQNGKILYDILTRNNLILVNSTSKSSGLITRQKMVGMI